MHKEYISINWNLIFFFAVDSPSRKVVKLNQGREHFGFSIPFCEIVTIFSGFFITSVQKLLKFRTMNDQKLFFIDGFNDTLSMLKHVGFKVACYFRTCQATSFFLSENLFESTDKKSEKRNGFKQFNNSGENVSEVTFISKGSKQNYALNFTLIQFEKKKTQTNRYCSQSFEWLLFEVKCLKCERYIFFYLTRC